ncbi:MAG: non-canonical purine NTP pyrophosphatase [Treponema sp.]|jgi:XTP/dITP diphosphohydrolase|nr:non-canonical purine NTP pyrophosphatase [Treponema sp.]
MKIYLATGNSNKKREMEHILPADHIVIPSDEGIPFDPEETGTTFYENSLIKARALWDIVHAPVLADDSGLCIDALGGIPGIYSSRYAGPAFPQGRPDGKKIPQEDQNRFIIEQTNEALRNGVTGAGNFINGPRSCRYVCSMVFLFSKERFLIARETMEGTLVSSIEQAAGTGGFGYDPLFFLPDYGKTAAQLTDDEKNAVSHRGKAARIVYAGIALFRN